MRQIFTSMMLAGGLIWLGAGGAQAQAAPFHRFCSETTQSMTGWACNFDTWEQCQEYISAERGFCRENPQLEMQQRTAPNRGGAY